MTGLLGNAALSLYAISQAASVRSGGPQGAVLSAAIGALAIIMVNGVWYLVTSWVARRSGQLPRGLSVLGMVLGAVSLIPPLGLVVLILSIAWSVWLGRVLGSAGLGRGTGAAG